jgi:ribose transport system substrate-binding protein
MKKLFQYRLICRRTWALLGSGGVVCVLALWVTACGSHRPQVRIAVIPQTEGSSLWDPTQEGAEDAANPARISIYWNAPPREDDVETQIALVDRVVDGNYQGLVLAPVQALSLIAPVRRALAHDIPTVIIGSPLPIPAGGNLMYILNDDMEGGRIAARRVAALLNGHGTVALLGINPDITGIMIRSRAFEEYLAQNDPGIDIVEKRMGTFNVAHEEQEAEDTLQANPNLDVVVALMWPTIDGTLSALDSMPENHHVKIIGFDPFGLLPFEQKARLDSVIREDTRSMGRQAIELIHAKLQGHTVPALAYIQPKLITRDNIDSPEVRFMLASRSWRWSPAQ